MNDWVLDLRCYIGYHRLNFLISILKVLPKSEMESNSGNVLNVFLPD